MRLDRPVLRAQLRRERAVEGRLLSVEVQRRHLLDLQSVRVGALLLELLLRRALRADDGAAEVHAGERGGAAGRRGDSGKQRWQRCREHAEDGVEVLVRLARHVHEACGRCVLVGHERNR